MQASPFSKTGGLGDVCGSLPKALAARGHRVMVVLPRYSEDYGDAYTGVRRPFSDTVLECAMAWQPLGDVVPA